MSHRRRQDENRLVLSLGIKVDALTLTNQTFHLFGPLKQYLGGKHFADDNDVQHEVLLWMRQQPKEFYAAGIGALIKRWEKCINIGGDYVEKQNCFQAIIMINYFFLTFVTYLMTYPRTIKNNAVYN
ncbi:hypothetical protein AVEN_178178-1 [Araneus ventricosus]|uniref:Histone-lysine N-methyltransferase SETMAR n=1 Tax=Araneus ventricosus TaxID=182803 RepID=A0A4Y2HUQ7_ARAVE|nr:hypothetical protein AVEN_178178-1 [Araneus ventricosus]